MLFFILVSFRFIYLFLLLLFNVAFYFCSFHLLRVRKQWKSTRTLFLLFFFICVSSLYGLRRKRIYLFCFGIPNRKGIPVVHTPPPFSYLSRPVLHGYFVFLIYIPVPYFRFPRSRKVFLFFSSCYFASDRLSGF